MERMGGLGLPGAGPSRRLEILGPAARLLRLSSCSPPFFARDSRGEEGRGFRVAEAGTAPRP